MNNYLFKQHEVLMSILVSAPSPQAAVSILRECFDKQPLVSSTRAIEVHEVVLPNRRHRDNIHEIALSAPDFLVIPKVDFTGSGASLNEPSIPLDSLTDYTSDAVKE